MQDRDGATALLSPLVCHDEAARRAPGLGHVGNGAGFRLIGTLTGRADRRLLQGAAGPEPFPNPGRDGTFAEQLGDPLL